MHSTTLARNFKPKNNIVISVLCAISLCMSSILAGRRGRAWHVTLKDDIHSCTIFHIFLESQSNPLFYTPTHLSCSAFAPTDAVATTLSHRAAAWECAIECIRWEPFHFVSRPLHDASTLIRFPTNWKLFIFKCPNTSYFATCENAILHLLSSLSPHFLLCLFSKYSWTHDDRLIRFVLLIFAFRRIVVEWVLVSANSDCSFQLDRNEPAAAIAGRTRERESSSCLSSHIGHSHRAPFPSFDAQWCVLRNRICGCFASAREWVTCESVVIIFHCTISLLLFRFRWTTECNYNSLLMHLLYALLMTSMCCSIFFVVSIALLPWLLAAAVNCANYK